MEAIAIASRLAVGMREEDADRLLQAQGIPGGISIGCSHGWTHFYQLTNGCSLGLDISPNRESASGEWTDGQLRAAYIQSNGVHIVSIKLK